MKKQRNGASQSERITYFPSLTHYRQLARGELSLSDYASLGREDPYITVQRVRIATTSGGDFDKTVHENKAPVELHAQVQVRGKGV